MQYLITQEELDKLRGSQPEVLKKLRTALLDHLHNNIAVRTHEAGAHDPYVNDVYGESAQQLACAASKGQLGRMTAEQFNQLRGKLWCRWEPLLRAIDCILTQAEESLK